MDKELLKKILRESTLSEAKPVGLALTDKVKGEDKEENDAYYKEVEKKMSDYEKASTSSPSDAIEEPKFNYDYEDEVEYHKDMEIRNGMEMLNYERKPSEKFSQRAKEAIEGSSNMGNNPEWANVYPEQQGFTGPGFGKELAKTIKGSKEKRDAASELSNKNTTSVNATDFKDSAMTKRPKSIAISEDVSKTAKALTKQGIDPFNSDNWQKMGINEDANTDLELKNVAKQIFGILKKYQLKPSYEVDGKEFQSKEPQQGYGARIVIDNNGILTVAVYDRGIWQTLGRIDELDMGNVSYPNEKEVKAINGIASKIYNDIVTTLGNDKFEFRSNKEPDRYGNYVIQIRKKTTENNNKSEIKESTKMKRLKFKKPFNGIETALKVIPESYKVDNKIFEMTDGNENYKIRWEGSLTEGKAVVLTAYDKTLVKEDMDKIKHLMGFKSQETLGNLKGKQRIEENNIFADMLKKTRTLMTEGEEKGKYDDGDGKVEKCDFVPCDEKPVSEGEGAEHLQELSPETYDKVRDAGLERGDSKGEELAKTANELKYRDVIGKAVKYLSTDGYPLEGKVDKIKEFGEYVHVVIRGGNKMDLIRIFKDSNDVKVQGLGTEVDRATANVLAKVKKLAFGVESKANDFKQLAETDKPD